MAWTTPRTWVAGEIVTSGLMNTHVRDNLASLQYGLSSTPPASPSDGDHWYTLQDGRVWHFIFDSAADATYPWFFAGGPPLQEQSSTDRGTVGTAIFADPIITCPFAGKYIFDWHNDISASINANTVVQWDTALYDATGGAAVGDTVYEKFQSMTSLQTCIAQNVMVGQLITVATANRQYKLFGHASGWDQNSYQRYMKATPVNIDA